MKTLSDVFAVVLTGIHNTESCLSNALSVFASVATDPGLKATLVSHREVAEIHVRLLEAVFADFGWPPPEKSADSGKPTLRKELHPSAGSSAQQTLDAGLIYAVQRIGHYKMASYECLHEWALRLDHPRAAGGLKTMLAQEMAEDKALTALAYRFRRTQVAEEFGEAAMAA
ncbi:MAG TPA: DUF892 family protein [Candidatus Limnocylindria bacterium]|jgi:ferritin-like metal-binding protein YciE|nr:DUF892 family protein [Candidatus Limnocylindria bacterium]